MPKSKEQCASGDQFDRKAFMTSQYPGQHTYPCLILSVELDAFLREEHLNPITKKVTDLHGARDMELLCNKLGMAHVLENIGLV